MEDRLRRARTALGRRGVFLALFGGIWTTFGVSVSTVPVERFSRLGPSLLDFLDTPWLGALWIVCGLLAVAAALRRRRRRDDGAGFVALLIPPALWTALHAWSWVLALATSGTYGRASGWTAAVVWSSAIVTVLLVAGWPDPDERT